MIKENAHILHILVISNIVSLESEQIWMQMAQQEYKDKHTQKVMKHNSNHSEITNWAAHGLEGPQIGLDCRPSFDAFMWNLLVASQRRLCEASTGYQPCNGLKTPINSWACHLSKTHLNYSLSSILIVVQ